MLTVDSCDSHFTVHTRERPISMIMTSSITKLKRSCEETIYTSTMLLIFYEDSQQLLVLFRVRWSPRAGSEWCTRVEHWHTVLTSLAPRKIHYEPITTNALPIIAKPYFLMLSSCLDCFQCIQHHDCASALVNTVSICAFSVLNLGHLWSSRSRFLLLVQDLDLPRSFMLSLLQPHMRMCYWKPWNGWQFVGVNIGKRTRTTRSVALDWHTTV